jgi:membrane protein insertase Oxa1/YidC/SpoIIIJ
MDILNFIWIDLLYRPIYNLVLFTYVTLPGHDMGLTIIYLAILIRIALLPASLAGASSSRRIEELKPQLNRLARMPEAGKRRDLTRKLLAKNRINVYATAGVILAQVAFMGILYQVFQKGFAEQVDRMAYFDVDIPVSTNFFNITDLAHHNWIMAATTAVVLYIFLSMTTPEPEKGAKLSDVWYVIALPLFVFTLLLFLPAAKSLFLLVSVLFSIVLHVVAKYIFRVEVSQAEPE